MYSFVATNEATGFSGDLMDFFSYLVTNEGFEASQYIPKLEAGMKPFNGMFFKSQMTIGNCTEWFHRH